MSEESPIRSIEIPAKTGISLELKRHQRLKVIDIEGGQVSDLFAFSLSNTAEYLSSGRSIDYNGTLNFSEGHILYSGRSNAMLTITEDQVAKHDFLFTPCSQEMFEIQYGVDVPHPNCLENLTNSFKNYDIDQSQIFIPFNIFMNTSVLPNGEIAIMPPVSQAGEYIEFLANMDLLIGITSCPAGTANDFSFGPIGVEIYD